MERIELNTIPLNKRTWLCGWCGVGFKVERRIWAKELPKFCSYSCRAKKVFTKATTPEAIFRRDTNKLFTSYKANARHRFLDFDLTYEEFAAFIVKPCFYCESLDGKRRGIDRMDNAKGYERDNIVPCCAVCNKMKMDLSVDRFFEKITRIATACGIVNP